MRVELRIVTTLLLLVLVGCSAGMYHQGKTALDRQDYNVAIAAFQQALERQPDKALIWKQLGFAYYKTDQFLNAANSFKQATLLGSSDDATILYLGLSYETLGRKDDALQVYQSYLLTMPESDLTNRIKRRVKYLSDSILQDEISSLIAGEDSIHVSQIPENSICVIGFATEKIDPRYAVLGRGITQMLSDDLAKVSAISVIERARLNEVARELDFTTPDLIERQNALRLGKLLGAATLVTGELAQPDPGKLLVEGELLHVISGDSVILEAAKGKLDQFVAIEKKMLFSILDSLGYKPNDIERMRLDSIPTTSFLSFLAYSRGLAYLDENMYRLAEAEFSAALTEDPGFNAAARAKNQVAGLDGYKGEIEPRSSLEADINEIKRIEKSEPESGYGLIMTRSVLGFQPEEELPSEGDNPYVFPKVKGAVMVRGTFEPD